MNPLKRLVFIVILIVSASNLFAFDGNRKGFIAGAGIGFAPYTYWKQSPPDSTVTDNGLGLSFFIGYGINNNNLLFLGVHGVVHYAMVEERDYEFFQGLYGLYYNHYLSNKLRNLYFSAGFGMLAFGIEEHFGEERSGGVRGFGYQVGAGYEFLRHFQLAFYYFGSKTNAGCCDIYYRHHIIYLSLQVMAY